MRRPIDDLNRDGRPHAAADRDRGSAQDTARERAA